MEHMLVYIVVLLVNLSGFVINCQSFRHKTVIESKDLYIGEELQREILPLTMGSRLYQLQGLKSSAWYEVKTSYPASIPASFSIQLKRGKADMELKWKRRLLNTEKLIFKADDLNLQGDQSGMYVLVTMEPEGVVAMTHKKEREFVIFNIVCDELLLGIPRKAWWVGVLVLLCLGLTLFIPCFRHSCTLLKRQSPHLS